MKKIILLSTIICMMFMTGCGCSKKEKTPNVLTCNYEDEIIKDSFTIYFKNGIATSFDSEKIYYFNSNEEANNADYDSYEGVSVKIEDNKLIYSSHYDYDETEKLTYDEAVKMYSSYNCE